MALYLVVHSPQTTHEERTMRPPTRMLDLAREVGVEGASPRWITTFSPNLHDDRIFSLWEADGADLILAALERYGFLNDMVAQPIRVQQWGPDDALEAEGRSM